MSSVVRSSTQSGMSENIRASPPQRNNSKGTFVDVLHVLGFSRARADSFEWLYSYPTSRTLLDAISSSFSEHCVLSPQQAQRYRVLLNKPTLSEPILSDPTFVEAAEVVSSSPPLPGVQELRKIELHSAKKRLQLLKSQKDILRDVVGYKSRRSRLALSPKTMRSRLSRIARLGEGESNAASRLEQLQYLLHEMPYTHSPEGSEDSYLEKEEDLASYLLSQAQQVLSGEFSGAISKKPKPQPSVREVVKSYGDIKVEQCGHEAQLARTNAILASLQLSNVVLVEISNSTIAPLTADLRTRGAKALKVKAKRTHEDATSILWARIHEITLGETLRRQNAVLVVISSAAKLYLEARIRLLCLLRFSCMLTNQGILYNDLSDSMSRLAPGEDTKSEPSSAATLSPCLSPPPAAETRACEKAMAVFNSDRLSLEEGCERYGDPLEEGEGNAIYDGIQQLETLIEDVTSTSQFTGSTPRFEPCPEYAAVLARVESVISENTSILRAVLRKRQSQGATASARNWARTVSAMH